LIEFPVSHVETYWWLPPTVAFLISAFTSTGGVTGAFIILPFQVSVLGYAGPGASATNLLYNIVAIPIGFRRYQKEKRVIWPLVWTTVIGSVPGLVLGAYLRIKYLPDPRPFKLFAGFVLLFLGIKLVHDIMGNSSAVRGDRMRRSHEVDLRGFDSRKISYSFDGRIYEVSTRSIAFMTLVIGIVGGIYGIGGGAILSPFLVAFYHLPVHSIAGATLLGTWISSLAGVIIYMVVSPLLSSSGTVIMPDWFLGISFGIGGMAGVYTGARLQRFIPPAVIKVILVISLLIIAGKYIGGYFL
jgi:uncharacterized membrane protein YfcA